LKGHNGGFGAIVAAPAHYFANKMDFRQEKNLLQLLLNSYVLQPDLSKHKYSSLNAKEETHR
jgi:hypothetical protein